MAKADKSTKAEVVESIVESTVTAVEDPKAPRFSVDAILQSNTYKRHADLLRGLLNPGQEYSHDEVNILLNTELNRSVKVDII